MDSTLFFSSEFRSKYIILENLTDMIHHRLNYLISKHGGKFVMKLDEETESNVTKQHGVFDI